MAQGRRGGAVAGAARRLAVGAVLVTAATGAVAGCRHGGAGDPCDGARDCKTGLYCDAVTRRCTALPGDSGTPPGTDATTPGSDAAAGADASPGSDAAPPGTDALTTPGTDAVAPPGTDAAPSAVCGDLVCAATESCVSCPSDCPCPCGNGVCESVTLGENCLTCTLDCGPCAGGPCGNGSCSGMETCVSCPGDCGSC
jgi:hypothetical protein